MTSPTTRKRTFRRGDLSVEASIRETVPGRYVLSSEGAETELTIDRLSPGVFRIVRDGQATVVTSRRADDGSTIWVHESGTTTSIEEVRSDGARKAKRHQASGDLLAPMPAKVIRVEVAVGAHVHAGDTLLVLEAMKMEHALRAPAAGIVRVMNAVLGEMVALGQVLAEVETAAPEVENAG